MSCYSILDFSLINEILLNLSFEFIELLLLSSPLSSLSSRLSLQLFLYYSLFGRMYKIFFPLDLPNNCSGMCIYSLLVCIINNLFYIYVDRLFIIQESTHFINKPW